MRLFILLIFLSLITACNPSEKKEEKSEQQKTSKDDFARLNDEIVAHPDQAELYFKRAQIFMQRNVVRQAFDDITKAVSLDSTKFDYYMLLADVCFKGLQIQRTINAFKKAISLDPKSKEAHLKLSELYLYLKAYPQCLAEANEAIMIDKYTAKAYFLKGFAYKETADTPKAVSSFQTAVEIQSDYYDAYIQLGNIETARKHKIALQYYNNALRIQPNSTEALYNRGLLFQSMGQFEKALEDYYFILKIDNSYSSAHYNIGYIDLVFKEDYKSAINHFTDAIRVNNQYAEAFYNRGVCYELLGDKKSAEMDYKNALKIFPTYKLALDKLRK
jgi:tetratricopeptide (TPR) repeat protein